MEESSEEEDFRPVRGNRKRKKSSEESSLKEKKLRRPCSTATNSARYRATKTTTMRVQQEEEMIPEPRKSPGKQKQPPLVVTSVGFNRFLALCKVKPEYKLTRSGIKLTCFSVEEFNTVRELLLEYKVRFYTQDRRSERSHRVVLRGLPEVDVEINKDRLKEDHNLGVLDVEATKRKEKSTVGSFPRDT